MAEASYATGNGALGWIKRERKITPSRIAYDSLFVSYVKFLRGKLKELELTENPEFGFRYERYNEQLNQLRGRIFTDGLELKTFDANKMISKLMTEIEAIKEDRLHQKYDGGEKE